MNILLFALFFAAATPADFTQAIKDQDTVKVRSMLEADPSIAEGKPVTLALFHLVNKEAFIQPRKNEILQLILAHHPKLDLWQTAALGTSEDLSKLLKPELVNALNEFGWSPLHYAAFAGNVSNVKLLLDRGADMRLRAKTKFRNSPFLAAMLTGDFDTVKLLLDRGADVLERQGEGDTALHEASASGDFPLVKLLVERGSDLAARDDDGKSPLDYAVQHKHGEVVEFLHSKGVR
jgi:uncharacterized protein